MGTTLLETTVAVGIVAVITGAALSAGSMAAGAAGRSAVRGALQDAAATELRVAFDALKYQGATLTPRAIATTVPLAGGSPLPVVLSLQTQSAGGATTVTITAASTLDSTQRVALSATLEQRAPLPGTQIVAPGLVPAPTGAP